MKTGIGILAVAMVLTMVDLDGLAGAVIYGLIAFVVCLLAWEVIKKQLTD